MVLLGLHAGAEPSAWRDLAQGAVVGLTAT